MSEPTELRPTPPLFAAKIAGRFGLVLVVGLAVIAAFGSRNRARVSELEHFEEVSALGDSAFFSLPENPSKPPMPAAILQGQALYPVSYKKLDLRETSMVRAGFDEAARLTIYQSREPVPPQEGEREKKGETFYFLKIGPRQFVKVRPSTPGK